MKFQRIFIALLMTTTLFLLTGTQASARSLTDQMGRQVVVPDNPQRVVALAPNITEIIFVLGQQSRLKGVTLYSDFPDEAVKLPKVGSYVHLDIERIVALRPDLCIAIKDGNPKTVVERLESLSIPVYAVDPRSLETVMKTIIEIGTILNANEKAIKVVNDMQSRIQRIESLIAKTDYRPRIFFQIGISPIVSVGTNTFIHKLILLAGGKNLAAGPVLYPRFSREQILSLSPDIIIITSMERSVVFEQVKAEWNQWLHLPAVRNKRIFLEDTNLFDRPTPRLVDGLELLVKLIHPELTEPEQ